MTAKIVVVGSFNADLIAYMKRLPKPGETVRGHKFITAPGGKGSNQAVAAARLGAQVTFVGRVGQDLFAEIGMRLWQQEGINTDFVTRDPERSTGVAPIFVDDSGENTIAVVMGANLAVNSVDVDHARDVIVQADVLVTQLEIDPQTVHYALQTARERKVTTILNPAPAAKIAPETLSLADYLTPNESELEILSGQDSSDVVTAAHSILNAESQTVIVTLGAQGACRVNARDFKLIPTFAVQAVDTTGAGDAFNGALAVALAEGRELDAAIQFANAAAALSVTRAGAAPSMAHREEVEALLRSG